MDNLTVEQAFNRAVEFHKNGKIAEADQLYTAILRADPDHPHANHNMGVLAVNVDKIDLALPYLERALSIDNNVIQFYVSLVDALVKLGQIKKAQKILLDAETQNLQSPQLKILKQQVADIMDPKNFNVQKKLDSIKALHDKGLFLEAIKDGEIALKTTKGDANLYALVSQSLLSVNEIERAHMYLKAAEALDPDSVILLKNYIRYYLKTKDIEKAKQHSKNLISHSPDDSEGLMLMGACFRSEGNFAKALSYFSDSLEIDLKNAEAFANRGIIYLELDNLDEAVSDLGSAYHLKPHVEQIWLPFLKALFQKRQFKGVIDAVVKMAEINPKKPELINLLEASLQQEADVNSAISTYESLIHFDPSSFILKFNYMNWLFRNSDFPNVMKVADELLTYDQDQALVHRVVAGVQHAQGKISLAIQSYEKALSKLDKDPEILSNLGDLYASKLDHETAIKYFKRALKTDPKYTLAHYNLGNSYLEVSKFEDAVEHFTAAIILKPSLTHAWNNLQLTLHSLGTKRVPDALYNLKTEDISEDEIKFYRLSLEYDLNEGHNTAENSFLQAVKSLDFLKPENVINHTSKRNQIIDDELPVYALTHFGRSGTGLLHSLIDNHSEISTLPSIYLSEFFNPLTCKDLFSKGPEYVAEEFITKYDVLFNARSNQPVKTKSGDLIFNLGINEGMANLGKERDEVFTIDKHKFKFELQQYLNQSASLDGRTLFMGIHKAYDNTISDFSDKTAIFYHIHNPSTHAAINFKRLIPDAKMVMMVREPLQSLESWTTKVFNELDYKSLVFRIHTMLYELDNFKYSAHHSVALRLEDLKQEPTDTLHALCSWLGIQEEKTLYQMTAQGKSWWGDPASPDYQRDGMDPFGKTSIRRSVGFVFTEYDQHILKVLFYPFSARFGYVNDDQLKFRRDLNKLEPLLYEMFDFEKSLSDQLQISHEDFKKSGYFSLLRSSLLDRFNTLKRHGTYPRMVNKL